jgi:CRISPR-associated protein Csd1
MGIKAKLINDTGEYVLGIPREKSKPERIAKCHEAYKALVQEAAEALHLPEIDAVNRFLNRWNPSDPSFPLLEDYDPGAVIAFRVEGTFPTDLPEVQRFWAEYTAQKSKKTETGGLRCIVCSEEKPVEERLPGKIKRIPGGQVAGVAIISANEEAFESYGLVHSLIAPTCRECAEKFTYSINTLIETESTHLTIENIVYIYWTRRPSRFNPFTLLKDPDPGMINALFRSVFKATGVVAEDESDNAFYATAFTASGARAALRDWIVTTVPEVRRHLASYFRLQRIADYDGSPTVFSLRQLTGATVPFRNRSYDWKKLSPLVPGFLLRNALHGDLLPFFLLESVVKRCQAEQGVRNVHAALIKMVTLNQNIISSMKEDFMTELELDNDHPAYLCGRLLAVIEAVQRAALGKINTTITDRYYGSASSAPASVFGLLLRNAQAHLSKLRKEKTGAFLALDSRLQDVIEKLKGNFPKTLSLSDQGLFALGYYHQKAKDRADRQAHKLGLTEEPVNESHENEAFEN